MGIGIAYVAAVVARIEEIILFDVNEEQVQTARDELEFQIRKTAKYRLIEPRLVDPILASFRLVTDMKDLGSGDHAPQLVIEAASENIDIKTKIFAQLAEQLPLSTVLATNTSSLSVTRLANAASTPQLFPKEQEAAESAGRVIGVHFFNPVQKMRLVEIIPGLQTREDVTQRATDFALACRKKTVRCTDTPGFIVNRINISALREAIRMAETKVATFEDIDTAMIYGMRAPMGPLRLADFVGLVRIFLLMQDIVLQYASTLTQGPQFYLRRYRRAAVCASGAPPAHGPGGLARGQVRQGRQASTLTQGFYDYQAKA